MSFKIHRETRQFATVLGVFVMAYALTGAGCGNDPPPTGGGGDTTTVDSVFYSRNVSKLVSTHCGGSTCHNPGRSNGLSLANYDSLMAGTSLNGPVVIPFDAENSHLIIRLEARDGFEPMPFQRTQLSDEIIQRFRDWIDQGALDN